MELYAERGYEGTTVADIAARAGLTERTFFRHFSDKRDVLFAGTTLFVESIVTAAAAAPPELSPLDAALVGVEAPTEMLEARRDFGPRRQAIIAASPELQERELIKMAALVSDLTRTLRDRGTGEPAASLAAQSAVAVFRIAFAAWIADQDGAPLLDRIRESAAELKALAAA